MRVLLAHKFFHYNGGADVFFFEVGRVLQENGHEVAYFSTNSEKNLESEWSRYFVDAPDFKNPNILKRVQSIFRIPYNSKTRKRFAKLLDDFKPDVIHCFNIMTQISPSILFEAKKRKIPVLLSLNDFKHICPNYKLFHDGRVCEDCRGGKFNNCLKHKCSHGSLMFSAASTLESYIHSWLHVYDKVSVFLYSSDFMANMTEKFWNKALVKGKILNPFKVPEAKDNKIGDYGLYFGRLIEEKGVDILLQALDRVQDIPFVIVGNGPDEEKLKDYVSTHNLKNVKFVGPKWGKELDEYLDNCRFVVVPSTWNENYPYVVLQAFAANKPVIGSNRGGIPEQLADGRGLIYDALDPNDLALKMSELNKDVNKCVEIGQKGRKWVEENFNDEVFYQSIISNYNKAINLIKK